MPGRFVNFLRFGRHPSEFANRGFDASQYALLVPSMDLNDDNRRQEDSRLVRRDYLDTTVAGSHPTAIVRGPALGIGVGLIMRMPHAMYFQDNLLPRLINDSGVASLRRGIHKNSQRIVR